MLRLSAPPDPSPPALRRYYEDIHARGAAISLNLQRVHFGVSEDFDPALGVDSVSWAAGGEEVYDVVGGGRLRLRSGGVLTISRRTRYAYSASADAPFVANMIVFPEPMRAAFAGAATLQGILGESERRSSTGLATAIVQPDETTLAMLYEFARSCRRGDTSDDQVEEQATFIYARLIAAQTRRADAVESLNATKRATRAELSRRVALGADFMIQRYHDAALDLDAIAREARLSRFHFIRTFKAVYGRTPVEFLTEVRMQAAIRLLRETRLAVADIAAHTGYTDRSAFYRQFRRRFGCAPSACRGD